MPNAEVRPENGSGYKLLLARSAILGRAEREASGRQSKAGRVAAWIEDHLRCGGRWVAVGLLAAVVLPVLWWGWELVRGASAFVHATADPQNWLPPFLIPYWQAYRGSIIVGGLCTFSSAAAVALRYYWTAVVLGALAAACGATALLLTWSLDHEFWHSYGHCVYHTCSGKYWILSRIPAVALLMAGLPLAILPVLERFFEKRPRSHDLKTGEADAASS